MFRQYKVWLDCSGDGNVVLSELFYGIERVGLQSVRREVRDRYPLLMSFERWKE